MQATRFLATFLVAGVFLGLSDEPRAQDGKNAANQKVGEAIQALTQAGQRPEGSVSHRALLQEALEHMRMAQRLCPGCTFSLAWQQGKPWGDLDPRAIAARLENPGAPAEPRLGQDQSTEELRPVQPDAPCACLRNWVEAVHEALEGVQDASFQEQLEQYQSALRLIEEALAPGRFPEAEPEYISLWRLNRCSRNICPNEIRDKIERLGG